MYSQEILKGTLQPIILQLLTENGRMYGYEITQKVKELSKGKITLTEGALYPALHKLEADGVLKTEKEFIGKRVRKYYSLSATGKSVVAGRIQEFKEMLGELNNLLTPKQTAV